jgi:Mor family transcriptional regulator
VGGARLTAQDVNAIRQANANGQSVSALATLYGVDFYTIRNVVRRKNWRHLPDSSPATDSSTTGYSHAD